MAERADLFQAALERRLAEQGPLAARMRPQSLDEMVGQQHAAWARAGPCGRSSKPTA